MCPAECHTMGYLLSMFKRCLYFLLSLKIYLYV